MLSRHSLWILFVAALFTTTAQAENKRAQMTVSVTVVASCSISSTRVLPGEAYSVACGTNTMGGVSVASDSAPRTTTTGVLDETRLVTILF